MIPRLFQPSRRRAVILILALWIAMILTVMAFSVARELRLNLRLSKQSHSELKAYALARTGLAKAVVDLRNDKILAIADPENKITDSFSDVWALEDDKYRMEYGEGTFTVHIEDEEGKININLMNERNVPVLIHILEEVGGFDPFDARRIGNMVVDYQDDNFEPILGQGVSEVEFYTEWVHDNLGDFVEPGWEFDPKNAAIIDLDELLEIPGFTRELLYGDPLADDSDFYEDRFELRDESDKLSDYITVQAGSHLNLNTMSIELFRGLAETALPSGLGADDFTKKFQDWRRELAKTEGFGGSIRNVNDLKEIGLGGTEIGNMDQVYRLNVASRYYTVTAVGHYGGVRKSLQTRVHVNVESFSFNPHDADTFGQRSDCSRAQLKKRLYTVIDPAVYVYEIKEI